MRNCLNNNMLLCMCYIIIVAVKFMKIIICRNNNYGKTNKYKFFSNQLIIKRADRSTLSFSFQHYSYYLSLYV